MTPVLRAVAVAVLVVLAGCSNSDNQANRADTMTRRQRDSVIGESKLPGAGGVKRALGASDSLKARNARMDSIRP